MHVKTSYCILLNITAYTIVIEPGILARFIDCQVLFEAHLRDASGKRGDVRSQFCPSHLPLGGCLWFGLEIRGLSRPAVAVALATAPTATTTTSLLVLASADSSTGAGDCFPMYFVNSWALGWSRDP